LLQPSWGDKDSDIQPFLGNDPESSKTAECKDDCLTKMRKEKPTPEQKAAALRLKQVLIRLVEEAQIIPHPSSSRILI